MSNLLAARAQMGTSLVFHIIFAALGVGVPSPRLWLRDLVTSPMIADGTR